MTPILFLYQLIVSNDAHPLFYTKNSGILSIYDRIHKEINYPNRKFLSNIERSMDMKILRFVKLISLHPPPPPFFFPPGDSRVKVDLSGLISIDSPGPDYDTGDRNLEIQVLVTDQGNPLRSVTVTYSLSVLDLDDNLPVFTPDTYTQSKMVNTAVTSTQPSFKHNRHLKTAVTSTQPSHQHKRHLNTAVISTQPSPQHSRLLNTNVPSTQTSPQHNRLLNTNATSTQPSPQHKHHLNTVDTSTQKSPQHNFYYNMTVTLNHQSSQHNRHLIITVNSTQPSL